jgi:hypothetical protein
MAHAMGLDPDRPRDFARTGWPSKFKNYARRGRKGAGAAADILALVAPGMSGCVGLSDPPHPVTRHAVADLIVGVALGRLSPLQRQLFKGRGIGEARNQSETRLGHTRAHAVDEG